jgi:hypothetical protein
MMHESKNEKQLPPWLVWAREIKAIGQTGIAYGAGEYDRQRYRRLLAIAAEIVAGHTACIREPLLADFLMQAGYHAYKIVLLCDIVSGEARPSDETMAVAFFDFDALPPLSSNRTSERHLRDVWPALQNGSQTTTFD